ncbi:N-acetylgalactosamine-6-sulfatase [Rhodopirellula rubra]|uniref:N-acetylgalactosamine-6-sulfatase n=1 Tax=Aporhodopirellula rubra TaxID=980271 RepID=A0A7W5E6S7_9BACT|nr:sulfatase-like hydrolase/transferase [Aporhodopirellula rubra]MBB3210317.1 N-acetylgalactosamine-6-sulfatase [Aporhodopirellula rubra]
MRKRMSRPVLITLLICFAFAWQNACIVSADDAATTKPNILFIFADDWGWGDLSCHDHPYVKTPNIDRLAREGTDFHRFTVASGVCSPSRTAVMTGHFPARFNIDGHFAWVPSNAKRNMPDWLDTDAVTMPRLLQSAGYATAHFGKWHLSNDMIPDSPSPGEYGYDRYGAFNCSGEQMPVHEDADNAIDFIESSVDSGKPFFVNLWVHEPHTPFHVIPKYRWAYRDSGLDEADEIYAAVLAHADERIGEVLDTLDRLNLTDNTLVIFSSDNGPARAKSAQELELMYDTATGAGYGIAASKGITSGRKGYKASLFEGGINVPFLARWPGKIAAGKVEDQLMISAVDLLPTLCEVAGAKLPEGYAPDGISQLNGLLGETKTGRAQPLFWKMANKGTPTQGNPHHWVAFCVVDQNWKLLTNHDASHVELYDIVDDAYEQNDLKESHPEIVSQLLKKISEWKETLPPKPNAMTFSSLRDHPQK